jgi:hypothetical protein
LNRIQLWGQHWQTSFCRVDRQAGTHPRHEIERVVLGVQQIVRRFCIAEGRTKLRTNAKRQPDIRRDQRVRAAKSIRRDADHGIRLGVDL